MLTPMSDLEAVNRMLNSIGQAPINTLPTSGIGDAAKALKQLSATAREVQAVGWSWNTDYAYSLTPDASDNSLILPVGALDADATDPTVNLVIRPHPESGAQVLYDIDNQTFEFTEPVEVDIIWGFEFNDLPAVAREYITVAAARRFQAQIVNSPVLDRFNEQDEVRAFTLLQRQERRVRDTNSFRRNGGMQRWTRRRAF